MPMYRMAKQTQTRRSFIRNTIQFLKKHRFNGLELNWNIRNIDSSLFELTDQIAEVKQAFTELCSVNMNSYSDIHPVMYLCLQVLFKGLCNGFQAFQSELGSSRLRFERYSRDFLWYWQDSQIFGVCHDHVVWFLRDTAKIVAHGPSRSDIYERRGLERQPDHCGRVLAQKGLSETKTQPRTEFVCAHFFAFYQQELSARRYGQSRGSGRKLHPNPWDFVLLWGSKKNFMLI